MAKYDFRRHYTGPLGAHLNCLTKYTQTKELRMTGSCKPGKLAAGKTVIRQGASD